MEKCPVCGNDAYYNSVTKEWEICLSCRRNLCVDDLKANANIPELYRGLTFSLFNEDKINNLKEVSKNFHRNVMVDGQSFIGKTTLLCAIVDYIFTNSTNPQKLNIKFYNVMDLLMDIENVYYATWEECQTCDILLLDDLVDTNRLSRDDYMFLYSILNARNNQKKVTLSSTNVKIEDSRLYSRLLRQDGVLVTLDQSWRKDYNKFSM